MGAPTPPAAVDANPSVSSNLQQLFYFFCTNRSRDQMRVGECNKRKQEKERKFLLLLLNQRARAVNKSCRVLSYCFAAAAGGENVQGELSRSTGA